MQSGHTCVGSINRYFLIGAINGFTVVLLGAFGAHVLRSHVAESFLSAWQTGVLYQAIHGLVLLTLGLIPADRFDRQLNYAGRFFLAGILLFSGSLYLMALLQFRFLGIVTPFGGVALLVGWALLIKYAWSESRSI